MLKAIILGYLAAVWAISHISLISCTPETCVTPVPPRSLVPSFLLHISDYLANHSFINIGLLHLIGQLSLVADVLIVVYFVLSTVFHITKTIISNVLLLILLFVVLAIGLAAYEYGWAYVAEWLFNHGVTGVKKLVGTLAKSKT